MPSMTEAVFDRHAVRLHRDRAATCVDRVAPILAEVADRLLDRLDDISRRFTHALDLGGRGVVAPLLRARGIETVSCELSPAMARRDGAVVGDPEWLPFAPASFDSLVLSYADPLGLFRDLQAAGEANAVALRNRVIPPRALFPAALARLPVVDGRMQATLRLAMMTGWAPSPSQPKPAARGSGQTSLARALQRDEVPHT